MTSQADAEPGATGESRVVPKARLSMPVFVPAVVVIVAALGLATWYGARYGDGAAEGVHRSA